MHENLHAVQVAIVEGYVFINTRTIKTSDLVQNCC